jgi:hypothetical protein
MVLGTFLIAGGAVLIAVFGIVAEPTHSLDDLLALFRRPTFVVYFSLLAAFVVIALATVSATSRVNDVWHVTDLHRLSDAYHGIHTFSPSHRASFLPTSGTTVPDQRQRHASIPK